MKFIDFKDALQSYTVFSLNEIRKIDRNFDRRRLNEWQDKGYIKKIIKGHYIFSDLEIDETILFEIANRIHPPSYVSLEMSLAYYNLVPNSVYAITSVSSRRPARYDSSVAQFIYHKIKPDLFFGYELVNAGNRRFKVAEIEKTLLDYFYLNPDLCNNEDFESLRFNLDSLKDRIDEPKLQYYLGKFSQKSLTRRVNNFLEFAHHA